MSATYHKNTAKEKIHSESSFQPKFKNYLFFVGSVLHYKDIKSEEKVYSEVCIFPLSSHIQGGFYFQEEEDRHSLSFLNTYSSRFLYLCQSGSQYPL